MNILLYAEVLIQSVIVYAVKYFAKIILQNNQQNSTKNDYRKGLLISHYNAKQYIYEIYEISLNF